jgi:hypothetical protein
VVLVDPDDPRTSAERLGRGVVGGVCPKINVSGRDGDGDPWVAMVDRLSDLFGVFGSDTIPRSRRVVLEVSLGGVWGRQSCSSEEWTWRSMPTVRRSFASSSAGEFQAKLL